MPPAPASVCFLFTDIEGSTRLWEQQTTLMRDALARHDQITRSAVLAQGGRIVKGTGDGIHAVFSSPLQALLAMLQLQRTVADATATAGLRLSIRCGLHCAAEEARDNDFYGPEVNRAARIMGVAHGGQMLVSSVVADALLPQLPPGVQLKDLGDVRLRDLSRPERLWQVLAPPLRCDFPALRSLAATPNNLAQPLNRFVGRAPVLAQLRTLLLQHRLVTLFGTGGIGKSRLSAQLGAELIEHYPDGVWFVELAPLQGEQHATERVAQAVASVLGVKEEPGRSLDDALQQFVASRQLLLILDNCEQVLAAAAALAKSLLQAGPRITVLATSREVLRVAGELAYPVPALTVPDAVQSAVHGAATGVATDGTASAAPGDTISALPKHLLSHEAVQLFTDRASSAQPSFRLTADNAAAVVEICRRLDGIPLALELAAARVRALPVQAIASRLRESFALLTTRDTTVAPRQRTLQLLIDWSHDLLDAPERVLFRRLSVFAGGWTLAAAEAVCGGDALLATDDVVDLLAQLVEKSLVSMTEDTSADGARYRLLDTVRHYAAAQLQTAELQTAELQTTASAGTTTGLTATTTLAQRHTAHFVALAEQARPQLAGPAQAATLGLLDTERENLLAALAHCARAGDVQAGTALPPATPASPDSAQAAQAAAAQGLRLSFALRPYWINRGLLTLGLGTTLAVLACAGARRPGPALARGLLDAGQLCCFMGRYHDAQQHLAAGLVAARDAADTACVIAVLQALGFAAMGLGDRSAARGHYEAGVAAARTLGQPRQLATALNSLAQLDRMEGLLDSAETGYQQSLVLAQALGDLEYIAGITLNLAMLATSRHHISTAASQLLAVAQIADVTGSRPAALGVLDVCAGLAAAQADWPRAALYFGVAEAHNAAAGIHRDAADEAFVLPLVQAARQALGQPDFEDCATRGRQAQFEPVWRALAAWLAGLAAAPAA